MTEEIIFEFRTVGDTLRVTAISSETLTEVTLVAPANAARHDLIRLAERKLRTVEARAAHSIRRRWERSRGLLV